jgi:hypothetical protein
MSATVPGTVSMPAAPTETVVWDAPWLLLSVLSGTSPGVVVPVVPPAPASTAPPGRAVCAWAAAVLKASRERSGLVLKEGDAC